MFMDYNIPIFYVFSYLLIYCYRVGIEIPKIEVRFENLSIKGDAYDGTRALPTIVNVILNIIEVCSTNKRLFYQGFCK